MKNIAERLQYLIRDVYNTTPLAFSKQYNDNKGVKTYNILTGRNNLSNKMLDSIIEAYPDINPVWLLTGVGEPILQKTTASHNHQTIVGNNNIQSKGQIRTTKEDDGQIATLKAQLREKDIRLHEKDMLIKEKDAQINKLLDIIARGKK